MRFLARFGCVVLSSRGLMVLVWGLDMRHFLVRLRYVEDTAFIFR